MIVVTKRFIQVMFNVVLCLVSLWVVRESYGLSLGDLHDPGPGFLPFYAGLLLAGLCLINVRNLLNHPDLRQAAFSDNPRLRRLIYAIAVMMLTILLFEKVGYAITMSIFMVTILTLVGQETWKKSLIITAYTVAGSYLIFKLLQTQLPTGPFGF